MRTQRLISVSICALLLSELKEALAGSGKLKSSELARMRKMAKVIRELRGQGRLQVVKNWKQIEAGIF